MKVAVAIIFDACQRVLITQRAIDKSHGGFWEFPGGKLEAKEPPSTALKREIKEEVGLESLEYEFLNEIKHTYISKEVSLLIFYVSEYEGVAYRRENQMDLQWVEISRLQDYKFPAANDKIIELIHSLQLANG